MITRREFCSTAAVVALPQGGEERQKALANELRSRRKKGWQQFDWKKSTSMRQSLLKSRLRLAGDSSLWLLRGCAIPEALWRPVQQTDYEAPKPQPGGNSGAPGYVLLDLVGAWLATGSEVYADTAVRTLRRVAEYKYWGGVNGKPKDTDLNAGALLFGGGFALDTLYDRIPASDRAFIVEQFARHGRLMYEHHMRRDHIPWEQNHTYIDLGGLWCTSVALLGEVPEAKAWYEFGSRVIKIAVHLLDSPDGAFYEGTHYWNFGYAQHLLPILDFYRNVTDEDPFSGSSFLMNLKYFLMHTLLPGGRYDINLGDAAAAPISQAGLTKARYAMQKTASEYNDPESQFLAGYFGQANKLNASSDPWTLSFWDPTVESRDPRPSWNTMHRFRDLDLITVRSSWSDDATHLALRCGPPLGHRATGILLKNEIPKWKPGTGHTHPDLNSMLLFDHGEHLLVDTGYTWTKSVREHSTVAVDGGGQIGDGVRWPDFEPYNRHGRIRGFLGLSGQYCYLCGDAAQGYDEKLKLDRFDRNAILMCDPNRSYVFVHDILESQVLHKYEWILLAINKAEEAGAGVYRIRSGSRTLTVRLLEPDGVALSQEPAIALGRGDQGGKSEARGHRLSFSLKDRKRIEIQAVLLMHDANEPAPKVDLTGGVVTVTATDWEDVLAPGGSAGRIACDGRYASVRQQSGRVVRWAAQNATRFAFADTPIFTASAMVSAAMAGSEATFEAAAAAEVQLKMAVRPSGCTLNGKAVEFRYDDRTQTLRLRVPAGSSGLKLL